MAYDYEAQKKYNEAKSMVITMKLNKKNDSDIIEYLSKQESKQGTIKYLIRKEIEAEVTLQEIKKRLGY